jgi:hypothetical protein
MLKIQKISNDAVATTLLGTSASSLANLLKGKEFFAGVRFVTISLFGKLAI